MLSLESSETQAEFLGQIARGIRGSLDDTYYHRQLHAIARDLLEDGRELVEAISDFVDLETTRAAALRNLRAPWNR